MARLTIHVLDLVAGGGAAGMTVDLFALDGGALRHIVTRATNETGRTDAPFLEGPAMRAGRYQFVFHVGAYFAGRGIAGPRFLDTVPVRFGIAAPAENYHVPLAVAPSGYSAYRGS
jgi:hydroxyisourate hydrolase